jgi:hypothetical protein
VVILNSLDLVATQSADQLAKVLAACTAFLDTLVA